MAYWLMKSEPASYGWDDLVRDGGTEWDGVRNNAARLHLRAMKAGDEAFLYHSMSDKAVVGIMRIARGPQPDPEGPRLGFGPGRARPPPPRAGHARRDQGRAQARQDGADPPVAAVGRAGARRGMGADFEDGRRGVRIASASRMFPMFTVAKADPGAGNRRRVTALGAKAIGSKAGPAK